MTVSIESRLSWWHGEWAILAVMCVALIQTTRLLGICFDIPTPELPILWAFSLLCLGYTTPVVIGHIGFLSRDESLGLLPRFNVRLLVAYCALAFCIFLVAGAHALHSRSTAPLLLAASWLGLCSTCCWHFNGWRWRDLDPLTPAMWIAAGLCLAPYLMFYVIDTSMLQGSPYLPWAAAIGGLMIAWRIGAILRHAPDSAGAAWRAVLPQWLQTWQCHVGIRITLPMSILYLLISLLPEDWPSHFHGQGLLVLAYTFTIFLAAPIVALNSLPRASLQTWLRWQWLAGQSRQALYAALLRRIAGVMLRDIGIFAAVYALAYSLGWMSGKDGAIDGAVIALLYLFATQQQIRGLLRNDASGVADKSTLARIVKIICVVYFALILATTAFTTIAKITHTAESLFLKKYGIYDLIIYATLLIYVVLDIAIMQRRRWIGIEL
ncbi:MAG: hypothetical protein JWN23_2801 [Rhodocyclales bacterium]|nr:hypothetical protein [Rhodocyclales bacterium]